MAMYFAVRKGERGKYMCRLVFKQGLHTLETCPLLIVLFRLENIAKKQHADVQAYPMDEDTIAMLNAFPVRKFLQPTQSECIGIIFRILFLHLPCSLKVLSNHFLAVKR